MICKPPLRSRGWLLPRKHAIGCAVQAIYASKTSLFVVIGCGVHRPNGGLVSDGMFADKYER